MKGESKTSKSLTGSIVIIVLLAIGLCVTTFALFWTSISVENNIFRTGLVKINLNDGNPVIKEHEFLFEPGMTVEKTFFIENQSTDDVYYKLYFENVEGGLAKVLLISIFDGDNELYSGTAEDLDKDSVGAADDILRLNEKKELKIVFHYPENVGNDTQNMSLSFNLGAEAVQTRNNPNRLFD